MKFRNLLVCCCLAASSLCHAQSVYFRFSENFSYVSQGRTEWLDLDNDNDLDLFYCGYTLSYEPRTVLYENVAGVMTARSTNLPPLSNFATADIDKDGDIDLLGHSPSPDPMTRIYINSGSFTFTPGAIVGQFNPMATAWFDLDNDTDLDIVMSGGSSGFKIFENTGSSFVSIAVPTSPTCSTCGPKVVDANGDGKIDILITGEGTSLFLNNGDKTFSLYSRTEFKQLGSNDAVFGDLDNDGDLDLVLCGTGTENSSIFYENKNNSFVEKTGANLSNLSPMSRHGIITMNLDNDGKLDLLISGLQNSGNSFSTRTAALKNNGNGTFTDIQDAYLNSPATHSASYDAGDYDNDGDTDLAFQGTYTILDGFPIPYPQARLISGYFRNGSPSVATANTNPLPPSTATFKEFAYRKEIRLAWASGSDVQTPSGGLFYNFYLRDATKKLIAPVVDFTNGKRFTFANPNATGRTGYAYDMPEGQLFYAVQSIDGGKASSAFSAEKMFYHFNGPEAVKVEFSDQSHATLAWLDHSALETNYEVSRSTLPLTGFGVLATLPAGSKNYADNSSFQVETKYYYRIRGYNAQASVYDSLMFVIPAIPTGIAAKSNNASVVNLTWKDESQFETGFVVERKYGTGNFQAIATLPANTQEYVDTGLAAGTTFEYRVRSKNENGSLPAIEVASATTNAKPTATNFSTSTDEDKTLTFTRTDFAKNFNDVNPGDELVKLKIISLPTNGVLYVFTSKAAVGQEVTSDLFDFMEFKPELNFAGTVSFKVRPSDGKDYSDIDWTITINVLQVNDAPKFTFESGRTLNEDFSGSVSLQAIREYFLGEEAQTITYSITPEQSEIVNFTFDKNLGRIVFTSSKDKFGVVEFTLTANDGQPVDGTYATKFILTIKAVDDPPVLGPISDITVDPVAPVTIVLDVTDIDSPITHTMLTASSNNRVVLQSEKITFSMTEDLKVKMTMVPEANMGVTTITVRDNFFSFFERRFKLTTAIVTGVKDDHPNINFFPNPASNEVNILLKHLNDKAAVSIKDTFGRVLISRVVDRSESVIDIQELPSGLYYLAIDGIEDRPIISKFIKL